MSKISQGGPLHPPDDQSGGWEAQGGPSHPPDSDWGVAPPPGPPLKPPLRQRKIIFCPTCQLWTHIDAKANPLDKSENTP